jgi:hypothetical protein
MIEYKYTLNINITSCIIVSKTCTIVTCCQPVKKTGYTRKVSTTKKELK